MAAPATAGPLSAYPPAGLDRRFYAFAIDRLIAWPIYALTALWAWRSFLRDGAVWAGVGVLVAVVVLVGLVFAVLVGVQGSSPGKSLMGLRVVRAEGGTPIGLGPALLRTLVLGVAALPTFGLGVATLAQTALMDRGRQRRGWHDHLTGGIVVDVRPAVEREAPSAAEAPRQVVNLTAMRLAPTPPPQPTPLPSRREQTPAPTPAGQVSPAAPAVTLPPGAPPGRTPLPPGPPPGWSPPAPPPGRPPAVPGAVGHGPAPAEPAGRTTPRPSTETERTVVRAPGGAPPPTAAGWRVTFDTGESFRVEGLALVGRRPEGRPGEPVRHLVPLPSEDMSVSKTHAQVQVAGDDTLVVTDRGSTNGSVLVRSGVARELPPGRPTTLLAGDVVRFGDRSMSVVRES